MRRVLLWVPTGLLLMAIFGGAGAVHAQSGPVCPDPPNKVAVTVMTTVTFDATTQLYTYQYEVASDPASSQDVDHFALDVSQDASQPLQDITSPRGWRQSLFEDRSTLGWYAFENVEPPADQPDTGQVLPPLFPIKPGTSLGGFSFKSPRQPGAVKFYATGFTPLPSAPSELEVERLLETCPALTGNFFEVAVSDTTQGPLAAPSALTVQIDIKPGSSPNSINPGSKGVIPVAILTTSSFDASTVDPLSVRFGPGQAVAARNTAHTEDVDGDGDLDLVLHVVTQDTGIRCGDTSATLTGKTTSGQAIQGSDSIVTVPCP